MSVLRYKCIDAHLCMFAYVFTIVLYTKSSTAHLRFVLCAVKLNGCICTKLHSGICIIICMLSGSVWCQRHVIDLSDICTFVWCVRRTPKLPDLSLRSARPLYRPGTNYHALSEAGPKNPHNINTAFEQQRQSIFSTGALRSSHTQKHILREQRTESRSMHVLFVGFVLRKCNPHILPIMITTFSISIRFAGFDDSRKQ